MSRYKCFLIMRQWTRVVRTENDTGVFSMLLPRRKRQEGSTSGLQSASGQPVSGSVLGGKNLPVRNRRTDTVREIKRVFGGGKAAVPLGNTAGSRMSRRWQDAGPGAPAIFAPAVRAGLEEPHRFQSGSPKGREMIQGGFHSLASPFCSRPRLLLNWRARFSRKSSAARARSFPATALAEVAWPSMT